MPKKGSPAINYGDCFGDYDWMAVRNGEEDSSQPKGQGVDIQVQRAFQSPNAAEHLNDRFCLNREAQIQTPKSLKSN